MALPRKLQMINGEGNLFYPETERFVQDLHASSLYTVISIIGPQSSGKSYLMNKLFGTPFEVLDARYGRKKTTKGMWIAKSSEPCMIILDVEGMDGIEREDDTLFERQSALFSLAISDVMLLNMWHHDIGRQNGANLDLVKLVFHERVKIEAPITEMVIVVRDHEDEVQPSVTKQQVEETVTKLWQRVNPSTQMSKYVKVTVKDFPHYKREEPSFSQKSQDLRTLLCTAATNGTLQQLSHAPTFAYRSKMIWDRIRNNESLKAFDQKLAMSTHICDAVMSRTLKSMNQEQTFHQAFDKTAGDQVNRMLSEAESTVPAYLKSLNKWDASAVNQVLDRYLKTFDDDLRGDIHHHFEGMLAKHRDSFKMRLASIAEKKAFEIKIAASNSACVDVVNRMLSSLPEEKEYGRLTAATTLEEFNAILESFLRKLLLRYDKETTIYDAAIRNQIQPKLERAIIDTFEFAFDNKAGVLVDTIFSQAKKELPAYLKRLEILDGLVVTEVLKAYLKDFDDRSKDVHQYFKGILRKHREDFVTRLTNFAEEKATKIQNKRLIKKGLVKACAGIVIGTAWAFATFDPSIFSAGICSLGSVAGLLLDS